MTPSSLTLQAKTRHLGDLFHKQGGTKKERMSVLASTDKAKKTTHAATSIKTASKRSKWTRPDAVRHASHR
jgi:hypothetical protein